MNKISVKTHVIIAIITLLQYKVNNVLQDVNKRSYFQIIVKLAYVKDNAQLVILNKENKKNTQVVVKL